MEKFYNSLMRPIEVVYRRSKLRSVMVLCSLMVTMLFLSAMAQAQTTMPSSTKNGNSMYKLDPDMVAENAYNLEAITQELDRVANPDLDPNISCSGLKVIFVLDESYSIAQANQQSAVRSGAYQLALALLNTNAQLRVVEFSNTASVVNLGGTTVTETFLGNFAKYLRLNSNSDHFNNQSYNPTLSGCVGYTNWHAALTVAEQQEGQLVIFFTDGNPTAYNVNPNTGCYSATTNPGTLCTSNTVRYGTNNSTATRALGKAVCKANEIKTGGKHMFVVGIGNGVNEANIKFISDNDNFANNPNIFTADYSIGGFESLAQQLTAAVNGICGTTLEIIKSASTTPVCLGEYVTFYITVTNIGTNGYAANNTVVTDILPASYSNIQITSPASGVTVNGNTITYNIGSLPQGDSRTLVFKAKVNSPNNIVNTAKASAYNANEVTASATPPLESVPPTITCPDNKTLYVNASCDANTNPDNTGWATAKDNCTPSNQIEITYNDDVTPGCAGSKTIIRTWQAKDKVGNTATCTQTIEVIDNIAPIIVAPANITVSCASDVPPANVNDVIATDNCSSATVTHLGDEIINQTCPNKYTIKRKYKATDACGNESPVVVQTITVNDNEAPSVQALPTITAYCDSPIPQADPSSVIATDNCGGDVEVTHVSDTPSGSGCSYTITRKYKVQDACGNFTFVTQTINVIDNTPPTASNPAPIYVGCGSFPSPDPSVVTDAADNCGSVEVIFLSDEAPVTEGCQQTLTRKYKVVDDCGNQTIVTQQLTRTFDTESPVIHAPEDFTLEGCGADWPVLQAPWTDNCSEGGIVTAFAGKITLEGCLQKRTYRFHVTDDCGRQQEAYTVVTRIVDNDAPVINVPAPIVLEGCDAEFPTNLVASWTDNCSGSGESIGTVDSTYVNGCTEVRIYKFTATDACGNTAVEYTSVTRVYDVEAPVIIAPDDFVIEVCNGAWPDTLIANWYDNCSAGGEIIGVPGEVITNNCSQSRVYTFSITDDCGNAQTATTTVTRQFNESTPTITAIADYELEGCNENWPSLETTWYNNCSESGTVSGVPSDVITNGCTQSRTYVFTVVDACGQSAQATTTVTRHYDATPPVFTYIPPVEATCNEEVEFIEPTVIDNCSEVIITYTDTITGASTDCGQYTTYSQGGWGSGNGPAIQYRNNNFANAFPNGLTIGCDSASYKFTTAQAIGEFLPAGGPSSALANGTHLVNPTGVSNSLASQLLTAELNVGFDYYDADFGAAEGNLGNLVFASGIFEGITVNEVLQIANDVLGGCSNAYAPNALVDELEKINLSFHNGTDNTGELVCANENVCGYTIKRTWTATDACGNSTTAIQVVTITDEEAPTIFAPDSYTMEGCNQEWPEYLTAEWTDNCTEGGQVIGYPGEVVSNGCSQSRTYTFTVTDNCGNSQVAQTTVTRIYDTTAPVLVESIADKFYQCDAEIVYETPEFTDNCSSVTVELVSQDTTFLQHGYVIVRTFEAKDACGNTTSDSHNIFVIDDSHPVLINIPENIYAQCGDVPPAAIVIAQDNCSEELEVEFNEVIEEDGCYKLIKRTWTVVDDEGNETTHTQTIEFNDTIEPVIISAPENVTIECDQPLPTDVPVFADNCATDLTIVYDSTVTPLSCGMQITRVWTAYDNCGNSTQATQVITIVDTTKPYIVSAPAPVITIGCDEVVPDLIVEFADNCDTDLLITQISGINNVSECGYQIERQVTATDDCGNSISFAQIVYVVDTIKPVVLYAPADITVECSDDLSLLDEAIFADNCDDSLHVTYTISQTPLACGYQMTRIWTATDNCGNSETVSQTIIVSDTTAPIITTELSDVNVECGDEIPAPVEISAYDNCSEVSVNVQSYVTDVDNCGNDIYTVYYEVSDECGNTSYASYKIYVVDTNAPELSGCPEDLFLTCNDVLPEPAIVTAWDACDGDVPVFVEDMVFGKAPTQGALSDCKLLTPARPANNPCGYPVDWSMALFGLPNNYRFYQVTDGHIARFPDGTMHLTARLHNAYDNTSGWDADIWFADEKDWAAFSNQAFPTNFKADCGAVVANHPDWLYYVLQASAGAELTGYGSYEGSALNLVHAPANKYFGFQLGDGANNYNAAENGFGGWFSYSGTFIVDGTPYGTNGNISGAGDLAFEMECCLDYYVIRQWTATDCSGNSNTCYQTITFSSNSDEVPTEMVVLPSDEVAADSKLVVSVSPNPANNNTLFTFKTKENAQTTLEVFDAVGKKVADVFMGTVEAGVEYKVNYNVEALSTGIYVYRLKNGTSVEVGKLIIGK